MGAAFTGHLQDRAKAQDQGTAIPGGVSSSSPNGQKYTCGGVGGWATSCSPPAWPTPCSRIFKITSLHAFLWPQSPCFRAIPSIHSAW